MVHPRGSGALHGGPGGPGVEGRPWYSRRAGGGQRLRARPMLWHRGLLGRNFEAHRGQPGRTGFGRVDRCAGETGGNPTGVQVRDNAHAFGSQRGSGSGDEGLGLDGDGLQRRPNLSPAAQRYLERLGMGVEGLFQHVLAVLHDPAYREARRGAADGVAAHSAAGLARRRYRRRGGGTGGIGGTRPATGRTAGPRRLPFPA